MFSDVCRFEDWETELKEAQEALGKKTIDLFQVRRCSFGRVCNADSSARSCPPPPVCSFPKSTVAHSRPIEETMKSLVKLKEAGYFNVSRLVCFG